MLSKFPKLILANSKMSASNSSAPHLKNHEKILLIRFKSIGDVLSTLPATEVIRQNFPTAKICFMVSKEHAPLLQGFREVNDVIAVDRAVYRQKNPLRAFTRTFSLLRNLRREKFSLVIDFQGYGETALLTRLSGAAERWGMVYSKGRRWAYTRGFDRDWRIHPADWNLSLLQQSGLKIDEVRNEFASPEPVLQEAREFFVAQKLDLTKRTLFIQPFTSTPEKNWPLERYIELARRWQDRGVQIIFGGGPSERAALEPAHAAGFCVSAGVPLLVTGGLMKLSTVVVGGDTGLLHLAVALQRRVVMIMSQTTLTATYPFRHPDWIVTANRAGVAASIKFDQVNQACETAFDELARAMQLR
jgi:ADP-heptose:LPS heptosyltransferase